jgi:hypothetical protein
MKRTTSLYISGLSWSARSTPRILQGPSPRWRTHRGKTRMIIDLRVVTPMKYIVGRRAVFNPGWLIHPSLLRCASPHP